MRKIFILCFIFLNPNSSQAEPECLSLLKPSKKELAVCLDLDAQTLVGFPAKLQGRLKIKGSALRFKRSGNLLAVSVEDSLAEEGELFQIGLVDNRLLSIRFLPGGPDCAVSPVVLIAENPERLGWK